MSGIFHVGSEEEVVFGWNDLSKSLERRLDKECESLSNQVISGQVESYEAYNYKIGIIQGLNLAKKHLKELRNS